ncbi:MAG: sel1 repeat family protein [Clostridiales Family XIII bacterium]|jgi:TPR repeat protein|nr:sel1 repeat family protein [Clostridiales Family XIII bacterium]
MDFQKTDGVVVNADDAKRVAKAHKITSYDLLWLSEREDLEERSDPVDAAHFVYQTAKNLGADALFEAGVQHYKGDGVPMQRKAAIAFFAMAAELGHVPAMVNTGMMFKDGDGVERNYEEAYYWFWNAMMKRDARATYFLGDFYMNGYGVVEVNHAQAADYYQISAKAGHPASLYNLGVMTFNGYGVPKDEDAGIALIKAAAEHGFAPALKALGIE